MSLQKVLSCTNTNCVAHFMPYLNVNAMKSHPQPPYLSSGNVYGHSAGLSHGGDTFRHDTMNGSGELSFAAPAPGSSNNIRQVFNNLQVSSVPSMQQLRASGASVDVSSASSMSCAKGLADTQ